MHAHVIVNFYRCYQYQKPGLVAQLVASLTADPGVMSSIRPGPILLWRLIVIIRNNFYCHSPPSADSRGVVSYKRKNVHKVLFNHLVKLVQEKVVQ